MNLKYYLRGLGFGIIVTALVMGFSGSRDKMHALRAGGRHAGGCRAFQHAHAVLLIDAGIGTGDHTHPSVSQIEWVSAIG